MKRIIIDSQAELEDAIQHFGILPFFRNELRGMSIEEMTAPGMIFGGNEYDGCWEWKGPVIRERRSAYGKFFKRKAGYVSLELLPHFLNVRRETGVMKPDSIDELLLEIISINECITSTELRKYIAASEREIMVDEGLPVIGGDGEKRKKFSRHSLEGPLQRLQMSGRLCISDFKYKETKRGERYGWGVAEYSTPEFLFDSSELYTDANPAESLEILTEHVASVSGIRDLEKIREFIAGRRGDNKREKR